MTTLYVTRHGETVWNTEKRMQGWQDSPLTDRGVLQAKLLEKKLQELDIDVIYSSPIGRTKKTSEILRGNKNIEIVFDDRLKEINMGEWEGMLQEEIEKSYEKQLFNFWNDPEKYVPINGETFKDVLERTASILSDIVEKHKGKKILIVTHTITLKSILLNIEGSKLENFWDKPYIYSGSLTIIKIGDNQKEVLLKADISHFGDNFNL